VPQDLLLTLVQERLDNFCEQKRTELIDIDSELEPIIDFTKNLLQGGKRFRALFCFWSFKAVDAQSEQLSASSPIVGIAAALEMFHAAALVHDDLLDQSDTRRGQPAIHKRFEQLHKTLGYAGSPERFGVAGSVLVGDMMLSWSSELFGAALLGLPDEIERACRREFNKMRFEVMAGQYLDVLEENAAPTRNRASAVTRAERVMLYKTAKYSLEAPLLIGSALGGASESHLAALSKFGIPLGLAYQLRDDVLGVFGDPEVTGKPAGDDLREGKRTVLIGLTLENAAASVGRIFEELLGQDDLTGEQLDFMRDLIGETGALRQTEQMISEYSDQALAALAGLSGNPDALANLTKLAAAVINRAR
jgi:geranylgeranyl diphosphate synthase, type I